MYSVEYSRCSVNHFIYEDNDYISLETQVVIICIAFVLLLLLL